MASRRRGKEKVDRGERDGERGDSLGALYEGPEVLSALLGRAGSPHDAAEVAARFRAASAAGERRGDVIPGLFLEEPRFDSPDAARRLYGNLLALWDRVTEGFDEGPVEGPPAEPPAPAEPPERGSVDGRVLPPAFVEAAWRWIAALPPREASRLRDRFQNVQPGIDSWLSESDLPDAGGIAAHDLVFEAWAMMDRAFDERLADVEWRALRELEVEPPPLETVQPSLATYVSEQLDNLEDDEPGFGPTERAQVERAVAAAVAALTRCVAE